MWRHLRPRWLPTPEARVGPRTSGIRNEGFDNVRIMNGIITNNE